jgi:hypothetical protein
MADQCMGELYDLINVPVHSQAADTITRVYIVQQRPL